MAPPARPFSTDLPAKLPMMVSANTPSQKNSGGPNFSATAIIGQASRR